MDIFDYILNGGFSRSQSERTALEEAGEVLRTKIGDYTVDSCYTWDAGYETAIWHGNQTKPMIIVERYKTKGEMQKGHKKWCKFAKTNPKQAYSVQFQEMEDLC